MPSSQSNVDIPLPQRWPERVRSAVVHADSLARVTLTAARGQLNEIARLREELGLLREEIRIKSIRMERLPAHHRHRRLLDLPPRRGRPLRAGPDPGAREPVPPFRSLPRAEAEDPVSRHATARIADVLCRAGRHLGRTTVRRMMKEPTEPLPEMIAVSAAARRLRSKRPNHI